MESLGNNIYGISVLWKLQSSTLKYYSSLVYFSKRMISDNPYLYQGWGEHKIFTRVFGKMSKSSN